MDEKRLYDRNELVVLGFVVVAARALLLLLMLLGRVVLM